MARATLLILICMLCTMSARPQIGGESVYPFLSMNPSSNYTSLGGLAPSVNIAGANAVISNPALIDSIDNMCAAVNMVSYVAGITYGSALYSGKAGKFTVTGGGELLHYGEFSLTDEAANELGTFKCADMMAMASLARDIAGNLRAGASLKFIYSDMEAYTSTGIAMDLGLFYTSSNRLASVGMVLLNMGTQLKSYTTEREALPFNYSISGTKKLQYAPLRFTVTMQYLNRPKLDEDFMKSLADHFILAAEIFPDGPVSLRGGLNILAHNDLYVSGTTPFPGFSFGIDVRLKRLSIQYSRQCVSPAASANMFSAEVFIGKMLTK